MWKPRAHEGQAEHCAHDVGHGEERMRPINVLSGGQRLGQVPPCNGALELA